MKKVLLSMLFALIGIGLSAQNQLVVQVSAPEDDLEEYIAGPTQTKTVGSMDAGSSDLELGSESSSGADPQLVGIRFRNVDLPAGAIIIRARIQFTVDELKNPGAGSYVIKAEANANPAVFDSNTPFNISSRPTFPQFVRWSVGADTWLTAGEAGPDQLSPSVAELVQAAVNQDGWAAGNAMVFTIEGTGTKVAESFDGSPTQAPKLIIEYVTAGSYPSVVLQVSAPEDDLEEYIAGATQTKTVGSMDAGSSDLELGTESGSGADPQLVGIRFTNLDLDKGTLIANARIQFTVDELKNTGPGSYTIRAQMDPNPATFDSNTPFNISSRPTFSETVTWEIPADTWLTAGEAGPDQLTPNLAALLNAVLNQDGWEAGNAVVFTIEGTGTKVAESFDGSPAQAPKLLIDYVPAVVPKQLAVRVSAAEDDLEEYIAGATQTKTVGSIDAGSSDLELGTESGSGADPQLVGIRFANVDLPKGSIVQSAHIQFTVDELKNEGPGSYTIRAQMDPNPSAFDASTPFNISSRPTFTQTVSWDVPGNTWLNAGEAGPDQRTPDLAELLNLVVGQDSWEAGNAIVFTIEGTGTKVAESFDGSPNQAPLLEIEFFETVEVRTRVSAAEDDLEEYIAGATQTKTVGSMDAGSSDLELGTESGSGNDPQLVGIRFANVDLEKGADVQSAYIQFTVDELKNEGPGSYTIRAQMDPNPASFDANTPFNISSRPTFSNTVSWDVPANTWLNAGEAGPDQRTPDLSELVESVISQDGWEAGNAIVFTIEGTGTRVAESFDGSPNQAPELVVRVLATGSEGPAVGTYPIAEKSTWSYLDNGQVPDGDWTTLDFDDSQWEFAAGTLGYGDPAVNSELKKNGVALFRKKFTIASLDGLTETVALNLKADDNATVYINGQQVARTTDPVVTGKEELVYFLYEIPKSAFLEGVNIIAVKVSSVDADLLFDASLNNFNLPSATTDFNCEGETDAHISCFNSLIPTAQDDFIEVPGSHAFQYIVRKNDPYTDGNGVHGDDFDFTGYVPIEGSSTHGYLSINYEDAVGGVGILEIRFNETTGLWEKLSSTGVDFTSLGGTTTNCSGTVTPWGTVITCEEETNTTDSNGDGYFDFGWCIEIDPTTATVRDYGTGSPQKLWALGRMDHENVVIAPDRKTVYFGEDASDGSVYKFIADVEENLTSGTLYVLQVSGGFVNGDPSGTTGTWIQVPNTTIAERNAVKQTALSLGGTTFNGVEDVDINPITGEIYFAVKGVGRVYSFTDNGSSVSNFKTFVGGRSYVVQIDDRQVVEAWRTGNDNLTFDDRGNLYVLQDGGNNYIWLVGADHTQENPEVEVFFATPSGAEPTGMTFTPDFKYMFMSVQSPNGVLSQADVTGAEVVHDLDVALVIARSENLGYGVDVQDFTLRIMHNNDGESKLEAEVVGNRLVGGAAPFKSVVDALRKEKMPSVLLSSGDNFLAGITFNASLNRPAGAPFYDAEVLDALNYDAIALGNHDFDFGPDVLAKMISDFQMTQPPYLGANLDFTAEPALQALVDAGRIAKRTVVEVDGQKMGVIGLIYPELARISSPRGVVVDPNVMSIAQQQIDELEAEGVNKILLITHLQSINNELELIGELSGVDIVIAGGGDEFLTNDPSIGLPGLSVFGEYPLKVADVNGDTVYVVTTPGEYRYVGNLIVKFDNAGNVIEIGEESNPILVSDVIPDAVLQANVVDSVILYSANLDKNLIAVTEVDLDGRRASVRTIETNQGNLIADAFLWLGTKDAERYGLDPNIPVVAVQNGGGIRNDEIIPANSEISEKKTFDILPFDNKVVIVNPITPEQFKAVAEHSVSNVVNVDGRFLQIAGFEIVWDTAGVAGQNRIYRIKLADGTLIVDNYEVVSGAPSVYVVTNNFTADGGDGFSTFANAGTLAIVGASYQRALYDYLVEGINGVITAAKYPAGGEGRIQKLTEVGTEDNFFRLSELDFQISPNPSTGMFNLSYRLNTAGNVILRLSDVMGHNVQTLLADNQTAGEYRFTLDQRALAPGMYYLIVQLDDKVAAMPIVKQ